MQRLIAASVIIFYAAFAPVCFSSMLESDYHAMNHAQGHHQSHGVEKNGNCAQGDTCANDPLRALSEHIGMYEHVTSVGVSMSETWFSVMLSILALVVCILLGRRGLFATSSSVSHTRFRPLGGPSVLLSALWGTWAWSRFHTNSPNLRFAFA